MRRLRNDGVATTFTTIRATRARTGQTRGFAARRSRTPGPVDVSDMGSLLGTSLARDDLEDVAHADVVVGSLVDLASVAHDHEAVTEAQDLLELGGDEHHGHALASEVRDEGLDLGL